MYKKTRQEGLEHLRRIEEDVDEIRSRTPGALRAFRNGILQGMGIMVGSLLAVALLGWILSVFGLLPGFSNIAEYLEGLMIEISGR